MARSTLIDCSICQVVSVRVEFDEDGLPDAGVCVSCKEKAADTESDLEVAA